MGKKPPQRTAEEIYEVREFMCGGEKRVGKRRSATVETKCPADSVNHCRHLLNVTTYTYTVHTRTARVT